MAEGREGGVDLPDPESPALVENTIRNPTVYSLMSSLKI